MSCEAQLYLSWRLTLDLDGLVYDLQGFPPLTVAVPIRITGLQCVDVEVFLVDLEDRQAKGRLSVVPE